MSTFNNCHVSDWLSELPDTLSSPLSSPPPSPSLPISLQKPDDYPFGLRKRARTPTQGPTPPLSLHYIAMDTDPTTPLRKKRRLDIDATPTQPVLPSDSVSQTSDLVSQSDDSQRSKAPSSRLSSPTKQFIRLQISNPLKIYFNKFDTDTLPDSLQDMRRLLHEYAYNQKTIPIRDQGSAPALNKNSLLRITDTSFYDEEELHRFGPTPSINEVLAISANSNFCETEQASEAIWNMEVHHQLLRIALRENRNSMKAGLINFACCTSAAIHHHLYKDGKRTQSKMVDFCLYIDSEIVGQTDPAAQAAIRHLSAVSKSMAVNHTDFEMVRNHPVTVAIESKRQDGSIGAATLQVGTWQAAQWKFLNNLLAKNGLDISTLDFLPSLIVQGPDWFFVASTRKEDKTILWTKQLIGSTTTAIGTYSVIRAIQCLAAWCAEEYWPWFRANVLDLDDKKAVPAAL